MESFVLALIWMIIKFTVTVSAKKLVIFTRCLNASKGKKNKDPFFILKNDELIVYVQKPKKAPLKW
jgi:hypothetical protein